MINRVVYRCDLNRKDDIIVQCSVNTQNCQVWSLDENGYYYCYGYYLI